MTTTTSQSPPAFTRYVNLAQARIGAKAVYATDDFFADKSRMLNHLPPIFNDKYDDNGKWMDGWESRRRRNGGHDFCIVRLGVPGLIHGVDFDTSHFTGNYPPAASMEGCYCEEELPPENMQWREIVPIATLKGNSHHYLAVDSNQVWTHVRLHIYPDGGIARLRVFGEPVLHADINEEIDLAALTNGARAIYANDEHFGRLENIIAPGDSVGMFDGWETRRRREPGNDWALIALACPGSVARVVVETSFFKGNFPDQFSLQGAYIPNPNDQALVTQSMFWKEVIPQQPLKAHHVHVFDEVQDIGRISHVRVNIFPDGGISRLRIFGTVSER